MLEFRKMDIETYIATFFLPPDGSTFVFCLTQATATLQFDTRAQVEIVVFWLVSTIIDLYLAGAQLLRATRDGSHLVINFR